MRTYPFIVVKVGDKPVYEVFYQRLLTATITDHAGNEADRFEAEFDDSGNDLEVPQTGSALQVIFGYENSISASMGCFVVESVVSSGVVRARSCAFVAKAPRCVKNSKNKQVNILMVKLLARLWKP
ncbi:Phage protein D [Candidatus Bartonella washoeensis]|nr:Phage protein D [Bartonella washoeensis]